LSSLPEIKYLLSGENATEVTCSECPCSEATSFYDSKLHSLIVLSPLPEAKYLPSADIATELM
jgi:hypothetical protein